MTTYIADGLFLWTVQLENGETRTLLASSLASLGGVPPSPVISATRGPAFDPDNDPAPTLATLTPASAKLGDPSFTLHVGGTGFRPGHVILWNGSPEATTVVSDTELTTEVNMATAEVAMAIPVAVQTLSGQVSNTLTFDLQPAA
jgi:hypothetical protein